MRHCLSINDTFIRVLPEAIQDTFFPNDPNNEFFTRYCEDEKMVPRSYWTTTDIVKELNWQDYIMNTGSNIRKALSTGLIRDEKDVVLSNKALAQRRKSAARRPNMSVNGKCAIPRRTSVTETAIYEWLDPSYFLDIPKTAEPIPTPPASPMAVETANQSAIYNIAVMEENEKLVRIKRRLEILKVSLPSPGPLKGDFFNIKEEREPAVLPSPFKEDPTRDSPLLISLPPIFNHPI